MVVFAESLQSVSVVAVATGSRKICMHAFAVAEDPSFATMTLIEEPSAKNLRAANTLPYGFLPV